MKNLQGKILATGIKPTIQMTNILFIAYEFPPLNIGGTQRPLKFVKYFNKTGINPIVLTLNEESFKFVFEKFHIDKNTLNDIPNSTIIKRVKSKQIINNKNSLLNKTKEKVVNIIGKEAEAWKDNLFKIIPKLIKEYRIKTLLVTAPPFSMFPLAVEIATKYSLFLITDFRDAWSQWGIVPYRTRFHYKRTIHLERKVLQKSDAVIVTSKQTIKDFIKIHPTINPNKFHYIPNGYDINLNFDTNELLYNFNKQHKIVIGYVGSFYYSPDSRNQIMAKWYRKKLHQKLQYVPRKEDWLYRSPYFFFKAIRKLIDIYPQYKEKIVIKFAGNKPIWLDKMINKFKLNTNFEFLGRIPLDESIKFQKSCDALLLTSSKVINGKDYSIAGKTYEYFTMKKPIIAFVTEGAQKEILKETGLALICNPDNTNESIEKLITLFENNVALKINSVFISQFHRKKLTENLASVIKKLSK